MIIAPEMRQGHDAITPTVELFLQQQPGKHHGPQGSQVKQQQYSQDFSFQYREHVRHVGPARSQTDPQQQPPVGPSGFDIPQVKPGENQQGNGVGKQRGDLARHALLLQQAVGVPDNAPHARAKQQTGDNKSAESSRVHCGKAL